MEIRRYFMAASNSGVVAHESNTGQWVRYEDVISECEYLGTCQNDPQRPDYCPLHNPMAEPLTAADEFEATHDSKVDMMAPENDFYGEKDREG